MSDQDPGHSEPTHPKPNGGRAAIGQSENEGGMSLLASGQMAVQGQPIEGILMMTNTAGAREATYVMRTESARLTGAFYSFAQRLRSTEPGPTAAGPAVPEF